MEGGWFLVNASPDVPHHLESLRPSAGGSVRSTPFRAILLTDAEIDHSAGLLLVRESSVPVVVYSTAAVHATLMHDYPVMRMLESYCGVEWLPLEAGQVIGLPGSSLEVEAFDAGGGPPRYAPSNPTCAPIGLTFRDRGAGALVCVPALARVDEDIIGHLETAECALVDGTFWSDDELSALGAGARSARMMGHLPLVDEDGALSLHARLSSRTVLIHVNNTNPILLDGSPERALLSARGVEIAFDGMEIDL